jgi:hypothetical protein
MLFIVKEQNLIMTRIDQSVKDAYKRYQALPGKIALDDTASESAQAAFEGLFNTLDTLFSIPIQHETPEVDTILSNRILRTLFQIKYFPIACELKSKITDKEDFNKRKALLDLMHTVAKNNLDIFQLTEYLTLDEMLSSFDTISKSSTIVINDSRDQLFTGRKNTDSQISQSVTLSKRRFDLATKIPSSMVITINSDTITVGLKINRDSYERAFKITEHNLEPFNKPAHEAKDLRKPGDNDFHEPEFVEFCTEVINNIRNILTREKTLNLPDRKSPLIVHVQNVIYTVEDFAQDLNYI